MTPEKKCVDLDHAKMLAEAGVKIKSEMGEDDLSLWFGLSYASFCVLPRILMEDMPEEWQKKMAILLNEITETYPNYPKIGTRVQTTNKGKLIKTPEWLINYRRPSYEEINKLKGIKP